MNKLLNRKGNTTIGIAAIVTIFVAGIWMSYLFGSYLFGGSDSSDNKTPPDSTEIPRISVNELKNKIDSGSTILIIDARSKAEYDQVHITGSISFLTTDIITPSSDDISEQVNKFGAYDEIVIYCT